MKNTRLKLDDFAKLLKSYLRIIIIAIRENWNLVNSK
jgi:hypothetical protein